MLMPRARVTTPGQDTGGGRADRIAVTGIVLIASLPVLGGTMFVVAVPTVAEALHATPGSAVLVVTVYLAVLALTQPLAGAVADRFGRCRTVRLGLGVVVAGSVLAAFSPSLALLILARSIQAVGFSLVLPGIHAQLVRGVARDGSRFGLLTAIGSMVAAIGPLLGGLLVAHFSWRSVFVTTAVLTAAAVVLVSRDDGSSPDDTSSQRKVPVRQVLGDNRLMAAAVLNGLDNLVFYSLLLGVPFLLTKASGLAAATALAILALAAAAAAPIGGLIADRVGHVVAVRLGFSMAATGLIALVSLGSTASSWSVAAVAVVGAGLGLEFPSLQAAPLRLVPVAGRATAAGIMASARQLGSAGGATLVAAFVALGPAAVFSIGAFAAIVALTLATCLDLSGSANSFVAAKRYRMA
jgi:MFS transporter, DHA1 family, multidrug resistance protein